MIVQSAEDDRQVAAQSTQAGPLLEASERADRVRPSLTHVASTGSAFFA